MAHHEEAVESVISLADNDLMDTVNESEMVGNTSFSLLTYKKLMI